MNIFYPKEHVKDVQAIDLNKLKQTGITHLIIDLDETLRKRNSDKIPQSSLDWLNDIQKKGFKICISSNNLMPWKHKKIESLLNIPTSLFSFKPLPIAFHRAMNVIGGNKNNSAMIGDQLFTDILGANLLGIYTILINPITGAETGLFRRIMRWLEQRVFPKVNLDV